MIETLEKSPVDEIREWEERYARPAFGEQQAYDREVRAYHDAATWLAETLDGRMRTCFEYSFDGHELYADDGGALGPIFTKSLTEAEEMAKNNPSLGFEARRRQIELDEYGDMLKMARGELPNTMITISDFPPELMGATSDVGGYNAKRKQTMLRVIARKADGRLVMQSQSLDGSNRQALEAIYASFSQTPKDGELLGQRIYSEENDELKQELLIDNLAGIYDRSLEHQNPGKSYRAGRLLPDKPGLETYKFVCEQPDLVNYLAGQMAAGLLTEKVMFDTAATMASRYENGGKPTQYNVAGEVVMVTLPLKQEMFVAATQARAVGTTYSGCGASVGANGELGASGQLEASGFGNKAGDCEFISKECPKCHKKDVKTVAKDGKYYGSCGCHS